VHLWGLASEDRMVPRLGPRDQVNASGRVRAAACEGAALWSHSAQLPGPQVRPLSAIMSDLGHRWLTVLKIDIEGFEFSVFNDVSVRPPQRAASWRLLHALKLTSCLPLHGIARRTFSSGGCLLRRSTLSSITQVQRLDRARARLCAQLTSRRMRTQGPTFTTLTCCWAWRLMYAPQRSVAAGICQLTMLLRAGGWHGPQGFSISAREPNLYGCAATKGW
jgi:hypothetical protein